MKKVAIALAAVLALVSIAGCTTAPPPPMTTKG
jgi:predicted small lipoprotein YifL